MTMSSEPSLFKSAKSAPRERSTAKPVGSASSTPVSKPAKVVTPGGVRLRCSTFRPSHTSVSRSRSVSLSKSAKRTLVWCAPVPKVPVAKLMLLDVELLM